MVLIISNNQEPSTSQVAEWLLYYKAKFEILTEINAFKKLCIADSDGQSTKAMTTNGTEVNFNSINSVWYRRGNFNNASTTNEAKENLPNGFDYFQRIVRAEWNAVNELLLLSLNNKMTMGNYFKSNPNKLEVLKMAKNIGLKIPETLIATDKASVVEFLGNNRIINKNIFNIAHKEINGKLYYNRTFEIDLDRLPETFFPSLFQKLIIKKYELRVFFMNGEFYSSAIFSQQDSKTETDFRNYNHVKPNRTVPFKLPTSIEGKLKKLMYLLELNTGSIDILVTPEDEFVFLEVNPDGQFGMVSFPCNYHLEKQIAKNLIK